MKNLPVTRSRERNLANLVADTQINRVSCKRQRQRCAKKTNASSRSKMISKRPAKQLRLKTNQKPLNLRSQETKKKIPNQDVKNHQQGKSLPETKRKIIQKKVGSGMLYRTFARIKYNKYKHQFPKLRESQLVTKIIKQWDRLQNSEKKELEKNYLDQHLLVFEDSSESFRYTQKVKKASKVKFIPEPDKKERKNKQWPTHFVRDNKVIDEDCSDFNRHSEINESQSQSEQSSVSIVVRPKKVKAQETRRKTRSKKRNIQKDSKRSTAIKNSDFLKTYWRIYHHSSFKNQSMIQKRRKIKVIITQKLKKQPRSKLKIYKRIIHKNIRKEQRKPVQFKVTYNKKKSRFEEGQWPKTTQKSLNILCHNCNQLINSQNSQKCKSCNLNYHNQCAKLVRKMRSCKGCSFSGDTTEHKVIFPQKLKFSLLTKNWLIPAPELPGYVRKQCRQVHQANIKLLRQRMGCQYSFYNKYHWKFAEYIVPQANPVFPKLNQKDREVVEDMLFLHVHPPVEIKRHDIIDGFGVFASRRIYKHELIGTYSGDVLTSAFIEKHKIAQAYIMALVEGLSTHTTWNICPRRVSSFGPLLNCALAKKNVNVSTLMCISDNQFLILMRAERNIEKGEELLYEYNGRLTQYDTSGFSKI